ncbi:glycosyltransferase [Streptomyces sp. NPDC093984]|uniref:glycosyltransferase n=1 Tax=Streptomyces sp. NPDC093984 TaxID=3366052 RepID=UPI003813CD94
MSRRPSRRSVRALTLAASVLATRARPFQPPAAPVPAPAGRPVRPVPGRVLHLVTSGLPHQRTDYTLRTQALARAQSEAGLDPHVVTRLGFPVTHGVFDARSLDLLGGVPQHRLLPRWLPHGGGPLLARDAELTARLVERLRPSVLHAASDHGNGQVALALRETYGLPVVYELRAFPAQHGPERTPGRSGDDDPYVALRASETYCLREADAVLAPSEAVKAEIVARGVPEERVRVAPDAVDPVFLQPLPDGSALRARLGIGADEHVVGTVGGLTRRGGLATLLEAGAELRRRGVPLRLLLVGDGPERRSLRTLAARLGLDDGTALFTGRVPHDRVRAHHAVLDVFAAPRTDEPGGRPVAPPALVEAMASGLPVAASDLPAIRELVESGVNGQLVVPGSSRVWADALEVLLRSPGTRRDRGAAARAFVARDRTWSQIAATTRATYQVLGCL